MKKLKLGPFEFGFGLRQPPPKKAPLPSLVLPHYTPEYKAILYMGDSTVGAEHIYRQWVDLFESAGILYFALFRNKKMFDLAVIDRPNAPKAFARTAAEVQYFVSQYPWLKAVFYSGNPGNLSQMMPFHHLRHIFIGHGDSDKATSSSRMFRVYHEVWVAGQAHADRLKDVLPNDVEVHIVGRPQALASGAASPGATANPEKPAFAFLPTWEGPFDDVNYSSSSMIGEITNAVRSVGGELRVKFHPSTGARITANAKLESVLSEDPTFAEDVQFISRSVPAAEVMGASDYCITDVSSIISDWIFRDRPIFVFKPEGMEVSQSRYPLETYCYTFKTADELALEIDRVVKKGDDYKRHLRQEAANYLVSREATEGAFFINRYRLLCDTAADTTPLEESALVGVSD